MREIKFRAWNKVEKKMYYDVHLQYDGHPNEYMDSRSFGEVLEDTYWKNGKDIENFKKTNAHKEIKRYEVMQYIGLKDKNGKEIYEGDIVKLNCFACEDNCDGEHNVEIRFESGDFWSFMEGIEPEKSEIIGNIYENKEK